MFPWSGESAARDPRAPDGTWPNVGSRWYCMRCGAYNLHSNMSCGRCGAPRLVPVK